MKLKKIVSVFGSIRGETNNLISPGCRRVTEWDLDAERSRLSREFYENNLLLYRENFSEYCVRQSKHVEEGLLKVKYPGINRSSR